jgi:hypothetical protein
MDNVQPCLQWLAELDVCMALAEVSSQQAFSRPHLVDDNVLHIVKGALVAAAPSRHAPSDQWQRRHKWQCSGDAALHQLKRHRH